MKVRLLCVLLILVMALPAMAAPPKHKQYLNPTSTRTDNSPRIDVNNILMFVTNHGNYGRDLAGVFGNDAGTYYPYAGDEFIVNGLLDDWALYAMGMWCGGMVGGDIRVFINEYSDECVPGPMVGGTFQNDRPEFKIYKLHRDSLAGNPNADYLNWPVDQGAPVDTLGNPAMIGDQMLWAVYNDANAENHTNDAGLTDPLGYEIRQTTFAFNRTGALGSMIFVRFRIYNKGGNTVDPAYFSVWADPDLGDSGDDLVGVDTLTNLGFVYNGSAYDANYGSIVPAVGVDFFQGPLVENTPADTLADGSPKYPDPGLMWGQEWPGYHNLGMVSFNKYINGSDPNSYDETYGFMRGLYKYEGVMQDYLIDGVKSNYMFPGDPVTGVGDLDFSPEDRRWMQTTGPIRFEPGDSTEILCAYIFGTGSDYLNSITVVRELDVFAQSLYPGFTPPSPPAKPVVEAAELDGAIVLTWGDTSEVDPGDYPFEGYTVWQGDGPTAGASWKEIETFDIVNGQTVLRDVLKDPNSQTGSKLLQTVREGTDAGTAYSYTFNTNRLTGDELYNYTEYYYKVSAFSFDSTAPNGDKFLESEARVTAIPKSPAAGVSYAHLSGEMLEVSHTGSADGSVTVQVVDPSSTTGHDYSVTFSTDPELGVVWALHDVTDGTTLLEDQVNQTGDASYFVVDGLLVKVMGPDPGVKPGDMFASDDETTWGWDIVGTRRWTWGGADGFGFEGFRGALGWGGPSDTHGFGDADPIDPATLPTVELRLATVAADGTYDDSQEDVSYAYRYLRGAGNPPAQPEFAPFIIDDTYGSYGFQDFNKSCPLAAYNMDTDPPTRLEVGYLENNATDGLVDGKYWPGTNDVYDNVASSGPREWLWIFNTEYSETPNPAYQMNAIDDAIPVMYWGLWNRHSSSGLVYDDGDVFIIYPNRVNSAADTYTFTSAAPSVEMSEAALDAIKTVPNPFYLFGPYESDPSDKQVKFINLPEQCSIKIYNLAGDMVKSLTHNDATSVKVGEETWNTLTNADVPVASGIYIYVVDAPGFGQKMGKMAIFTEVEVLNRY